MSIRCNCVVYLDCNRISCRMGCITSKDHMEKPKGGNPTYNKAKGYGPGAYQDPVNYVKNATTINSNMTIYPNSGNQGQYGQGQYGQVQPKPYDPNIIPINPPGEQPQTGYGGWQGGNQVIGGWAGQPTGQAGNAWGGYQWNGNQGAQWAGGNPNSINPQVNGNWQAGLNNQNNWGVVSPQPQGGNNWNQKQGHGQGQGRGQGRGQGHNDDWVGAVTAPSAPNNDPAKPQPISLNAYGDPFSAQPYPELPLPIKDFPKQPQPQRNP